MRVQLALNVDDLEAAIEYYSKLFDAKVNKRKPGYANFAIDQPPLKRVLFENPGAAERLNHLGVEVFEDESVRAATDRLRAAGMADAVEDATTCCYATQNKVWSSDPQGLRWEWYRIIEDAPEFGTNPELAWNSGDGSGGNASACPERPELPYRRRDDPKLARARHRDEGQGTNRDAAGWIQGDAADHRGDTIGAPSRRFDLFAYPRRSTRNRKDDSMILHAMHDWRTSVVAFVLGIALVATAGPAFAVTEHSAARKVGRGLAAMTCGFLEIPGNIVKETRERGAGWGFTLGFAKGLGSLVVRELVGVYEFVTSPFPIPEGYVPIIDPEFPWDYFDEHTN